MLWLGAAVLMVGLAGVAGLRFVRPRAAIAGRVGNIGTLNTSRENLALIAPATSERKPSLPHKSGDVTMGYRVAVVGATGAVGREMLNILEELEFPVDRMHAIASRNSLGVEVGWKNGVVKCEDLAQFDFSRVDIVLMSAGKAISKAWAEKIGEAGPIVIDNSSAWRMDPDVPLIVPEVNPDDAEWADRKNIIANPNCSTAQLVVALKPLHDAARIKRAVVATYQSVSGAGKQGMDELWNQYQGHLRSRPLRTESVPQADRLQRHPVHRHDA